MGSGAKFSRSSGMNLKHCLRAAMWLAPVASQSLWSGPWQTRVHSQSSTQRDARLLDSLSMSASKRPAPVRSPAAGTRFRLIEAQPETGSSVARYLELDVGSLAEEHRPLIGLLAPEWLGEGGFDAILREARAFGVAMRKRIDQAIRQRVLPGLGLELGRWAASNGWDLANDVRRHELEAAALTFTFRGLFLLYAESAGHLPVSHESYHPHSFSQIVRDAAGELDSRASSLWRRVQLLVEAMRTGNAAWSVPGYNGDLFAPGGFEGPRSWSRPRFPIRRLAAARRARHRSGHGGRLRLLGPRDRSPRPHLRGAACRSACRCRPRLRLRRAARPLPPAAGRRPTIAGESALAHQRGRAQGRRRLLHAASSWSATSSGARGAALRAPPRGGRGDARRHRSGGPRRAPLRLQRARPGLRQRPLPRGVVDELADQVARFLGELPLPAVAASSTTSARARARPTAPPSRTSRCLRRLVLKRCVYGVDLSPMGAEIAKVSLWLASFVPGLSLSYLDHNIQVGNSLIGVASAGATARRERRRRPRDARDGRGGERRRGRRGASALWTGPGRGRRQ